MNTYIKEPGLWTIAILGMMIGFLGGRAEDYPLNKARIFKIQDGRQIIRTYRSGNQDQIFIQPSLQDSVYIHLQTYFEKQGIKGYDKQIEESRIKKLVGW